jgi:transposase
VIWRWRWRAGSAAHQALMGRLPLEHLDHLDDMIARPDAHIEAMMVPFRRQRDLLATIPGIRRGPLG